MQEFIILNDAYWVVVNKPALMPTQPDPTGELSLLEQLEKFLKQPLFIIHRLDRVASGIVVLAKTHAAAANLSEQFRQKHTLKVYLAIVEKCPSEHSGTLVHFLKKNAKTNTSQAFFKEVKDSKKAELQYILRGGTDRYFLLGIELLTGRHHQIRAQLGKIGCPIKGDVKYGAKRSNKNRAIYLHAYQLTIRHPQTNELVTLRAMPDITDTLWQYCMNLT